MRFHGDNQLNSRLLATALGWGGREEVRAPGVQLDLPCRIANELLEIWNGQTMQPTV